MEIDYEKALEMLENLLVLNNRFIIQILEDAIKAESLMLESNELLRDENKCQEIRARISDAKVLLSFFYLLALDNDR